MESEGFLELKEYILCYLLAVSLFDKSIGLMLWKDIYLIAVFFFFFV